MTIKSSIINGLEIFIEEKSLSKDIEPKLMGGCVCKNVSDKDTYLSKSAFG